MTRLEKVKKWVYNLIREDDSNDWKANIFDGIIITLIVINVVQVVADTFQLPPMMQQISYIIEVVSVAVFSLEYVMRVWVSTYLYPDSPHMIARLRYIISFMAIVDLLAILPFYVPFIIPVDLRVLRSLRMIRLLRLFKVNRYTSALSAIAQVFKSRASQLLSSMFIVGLLMLISAVLMYNIESAAQPDTFHNAFDALWWAVATFTTVGYGDIYPVTDAGKILSAIIAILGIGLVAVPTGIISAGFMEQVEHRKIPKADEDIYKNLEKLFELKKAGIITEEEFLHKKRQLLGL